jgi:hypothetical protein
MSIAHHRAGAQKIYDDEKQYVVDKDNVRLGGILMIVAAVIVGPKVADYMKQCRSDRASAAFAREREIKRREGRWVG